MITTSGKSRDNSKFESSRRIARRDNNPDVNLYNYKLIFNQEFFRREIDQVFYNYKLYQGPCNCRETSAWRRVAAARVINKYPVLAVMLFEGRTNLSVLAIISKIINKTNCEDIIKIINNKSYREAEQLLSVYRPVPKIRDRIKVISVLEEELASPDKCAGEQTGQNGNSGVDCDSGGVDQPGPNSGSGKTGISSDVEPGKKSVDNQDNNDSTDSDAIETESGENNKSSSDVEPGKKSVGELKSIGAGSDNRGDSQKEINTKLEKKVILKNKYELRFMADPEFMDKLNKIKSLLSNKFPTGISLEALFDITMEAYLDRHDPERRLARRKNRENKIKKKLKNKTGSNKSGVNDSSPDNNNSGIKKPTKPCNDATRRKSAGGDKQIADNTKNNSGLSSQPQGHNSRYIPQAVRDEVYARDGGRCTFVGKKGKRCNCTHDLEFDHIIPFARGGDNSPDNLRLLCRKHNRLEAEKAYGKKFMEKHY